MGAPTLWVCFLGGKCSTLNRVTSVCMIGHVYLKLDLPTGLLLYLINYHGSYTGHKASMLLVNNVFVHKAVKVYGEQSEPAKF